MNYPISEPSDGWMPYEKIFLRQLVLSVYKRIHSPLDKFIFMAAKETGYTEEEIAKIVGISQPAISKRITKIMILLKSSPEKKLYLGK
jgi:DNA-directed RNA polymerase specialized sigma subunit